MVDGDNEYLFRFPTFDDVKFLDPLSDDKSDQIRSVEKSNGWNKLDPLARRFYKLLKKSSANIFSLENNIQCLTPKDLNKIKKTAHCQEGASSSGNQVIERSSNSESEMASWHIPEKRKREENSEEENNLRHQKIAKISDKKANHTMSSDDSEDFSHCSEKHLISGITYSGEQPSARVRDSVQLPNNTVSVSEEDEDDPAENSYESVENGEGSESEIDRSAQDSDSEDKKSAVQSQLVSLGQSQNHGDKECSDKIFREHVFTKNDEEEVSKFSSLLSKDIVENNHVWILQCPVNMDCSNLVGQKIDLGGCCKLEADNRSYESFSYKSKGSRFATLAVPSFRNQLQLMRIPVSGNIIVEEFLDITSDSGYSVAETPSRVEIPDNLPTRHPLFGKNYKQQLKMAKKMEQEALKIEPIDTSSEQESFERNSILSDSSTSHKKKKKKKKSRQDS